MSLESCGLKYAMWNVGIKELLNIESDILFKTN